MSTFETAFLEKLQWEPPPDAGMRAEIDPPVDRYIGEGEEPFYYSVSAIQPCDEAEFDELVRREVSLARARRRTTFEWKTFDFQNMPFQDGALERNEFKLQRTSRLLHAPAAFVTDLPADVSVRVVGGNDFELLMSLNERAFGQRAEWLSQGLRREIVEQPRKVKAFFAFVGDEVAACGWIKVYSKVGLLFGGGTLPDLRGKGAYRALVAARSQFAYAAGADYVACECSPDSERVLRALEFTDAGAARQWVRELPKRVRP